MRQGIARLSRVTGGGDGLLAPLDRGTWTTLVLQHRRVPAEEPRSLCAASSPSHIGQRSQRLRQPTQRLRVPA